MLLFDGTLFTDDELLRAGGGRTGRQMGHLSIAGLDGSLAVLRTLPARTKAYVHVNNTNPILIEGSPERDRLEQAGISVAADGMEIAL